MAAKNMTPNASREKFDELTQTMTAEQREELRSMLQPDQPELATVFGAMTETLNAQTQMYNQTANPHEKTIGRLKEKQESASKTLRTKDDGKAENTQEWRHVAETIAEMVLQGELQELHVMLLAAIWPGATDKDRRETIWFLANKQSYPDFVRIHNMKTSEKSATRSSTIKTDRGAPIAAPFPFLPEEMAQHTDKVTQVNMKISLMSQTPLTEHAVTGGGRRGGVNQPTWTPTRTLGEVTKAVTGSGVTCKHVVNGETGEVETDVTPVSVAFQQHTAEMGEQRAQICQLTQQVANLQQQLQQNLIQQTQFQQYPQHQQQFQQQHQQFLHQNQQQHQQVQQQPHFQHQSQQQPQQAVMEQLQQLIAQMPAMGATTQQPQQQYPANEKYKAKANTSKQQQVKAGETTAGPAPTSPQGEVQK